VARIEDFCPFSGKKLEMHRHIWLSDPMPSDANDLLDYLARTTRLSRAEAEKVVADVLAYFGESPEEFVLRRHTELRAQSVRNPQIFTRIATEMRERRFAAPALSERQIRRLIYG
jgi:uncharacterized protein YdaU (DUF1376 family)